MAWFCEYGYGRRVFTAMRRSSARRAIVLTSASVGLRNVSRSVSRTQRPAARNVVGGISCNISKLLEWSLLDCCGLRLKSAQRKGEAGFPPPLGALVAPPVQQDPAESECSTVYSAASAIGIT